MSITGWGGKKVKATTTTIKEPASTTTSENRKSEIYQSKTSSFYGNGPPTPTNIMASETFSRARKKKKIEPKEI